MSKSHPKGAAAARTDHRVEGPEGDDHSTDDDKVPPPVPAPLPSFARLIADTGPLIPAASIAPLSVEISEAAKRKVKKACFLCKNAHACCDYKRPCSRCIKNGMSEVCFDTEGKKRGRKTKAQKAAEAIMRMNGTNPTDTVAPPAIINPLLATAVPPAALSSLPIEPDAAGAIVTRPAAAIPPVPQAMSRDRTLTDVNRLLLSEIRELKADQDRLYEEIRSLKEQQSMRQRQTPTAVANVQPSPLAITSNNDTTAAVVVYDLTKKPPVVQSANTSFCRMLGYSVEEVHGASWHKFVYPPYVERALGILQPHLSSRGQSTTSVTFEQVYQHKSGAVVRTVDSHNIFFIDGQPSTDVITVSPLSSAAPLPSISLESSAPAAAIQAPPPPKAIM